MLIIRNRLIWQMLIAGSGTLIVLLLFHCVTVFPSVPVFERRHAVMVIDEQLWWVTERQTFGRSRYACMPVEKSPTTPEEMRFSAPAELTERLKNLVANSTEVRQIVIDYQGFPFQWAVGSLSVSGKQGESLRQHSILSQSSMYAYGDIYKDWPTFSSVAYGLRSLSLVCGQIIICCIITCGIFVIVFIVKGRQ